MACCPEPQPQPRMELKEGPPETDRAESMAALSKGAGAQEGRPLNLCLETSSLFPLPLPRQAQPGSSHLKWVPGSLGERGWPGCRPVRPTPPPPLGPSPSWGRGREGELSLQTHPSRGPSLPHTPSEAPLQLFQPWRGVGRRGNVGKSAPSPFPKGHGAWGGGNPPPWGYSRAGHWGASPGGAPILLFALDECSLTPSTPPPLNKQRHPPHPPHTQRDLVSW